MNLAECDKINCALFSILDVVIDVRLSRSRDYMFLHWCAYFTWSFIIIVYFFGVLLYIGNRHSFQKFISEFYDLLIYGVSDFFMMSLQNLRCHSRNNFANDFCSALVVVESSGWKLSIQFFIYFVLLPLLASIKRAKKKRKIPRDHQV